MKIVIAGGTGHVGAALIRAFLRDGHQIVVLTRRRKNPEVVRQVPWDGKTPGAWTAEIEGADVVINLAGRSVDCRYTRENLEAMLASRIDSTRVIGLAVATARNPPSLWLQASTATYYAHRYDRPNDEIDGRLGNENLDRPARWNPSTRIARWWEETLFSAATPRTRKVAMRSAVTMSPDRGSIFHVLATLAKLGLGGTAGDGRQRVSWIHEYDFCNAVRFLIAHAELSGPVNLCSPNPLPNREFMAGLRAALDVRIAFPQPAWLLEIGAFFMRTETELLLKSRYVAPRVLLNAGFEFKYPDWPAAAAELASRLA